MPLVIANPRGQQDGSTRTQFTDTTNTTSVTYTYPTTQSSLIIENSGERVIYVTVGGVTNQAIQVDTKYRYDGSFTSFSIRSDVNSQEFIATAIYDDSINTKLAEKTPYNTFSDLLISGQITSIKLIGDSVNWGAKATNYASANSGRLIYGSNYEQDHSVNCWANLMRNAINALYPSIDVFNAGINGYAMSDLSANKSAWFGANQDVVIITLGINDLAKSATIAQFETYMEDVITYGLANCKHLYFATTPPLSAIPNTGANGFTAEMINQSIKKKCQAHNIPCLDINTIAIQLATNSQMAFDTTGYYFNDTTHPSDAGHAILYKAYQLALGFKNKQTDFMVTPVLAVNNTLKTTGAIPPNNYVKIATITINQQFFGFYGSFFLRATPGNSLLNSTAILDVAITQSAAMGSDAAKLLEVTIRNNGGSVFDFYKTAFIARTRILTTGQTVIDVYIKNTNSGNRIYEFIFLGGVNTAGTEVTFTIANDLTVRAALDTQAAGTTDVTGVFTQSKYLGSPDGSIWAQTIDNTGVTTWTKKA